ncbi:hypothetical protein P8936_09310 [Edaphobacter paludis]|uniref:Uncharacterized protein n=1 Tax=Edaphobacter paludis TaxID=3035702 RepID=A0AAU7CTC6_9BACT
MAPTTQAASQTWVGEAGLLLKRAIAADSRQPDAYYQMGILDQQQLQWQASVAMLSPR